MTVKLDLLEEESFYESDFVEVPPSDIVAYNELRSCADLFRMYSQGILKIQPEFERDIVWQGPAQTRFIDSLIKQLPIPSMCFSYDAQRQEWMVIDGLQRIATIVKFLEGGDWKLSILDDIDKNIAGKSVAAMKTSDKELRQYYQRVENLTIPITVLRCNYSKKSHLEYLFTIFHRLNTGGMKLNNQEIRNCIYAGKFNRLLKELDEIPSWRKINKMKKDKSYRFTKQELILRFFAFYDRHKLYTGRLAKFLNDYMEENRYISDTEMQAKKSLFQLTSDLILRKVFNQETPPKTSITLLESLFVAVAKNIGYLSGLRGLVVARYYDRMVKNENFDEASLSEGLSRKQKVIDRMDAAIRIFSGPA